MFFGKFDNKENNRLGFFCFLKKSCLDLILCFILKVNLKINELFVSLCLKVDIGNCSFDSDDVNVIESSLLNVEYIVEILLEGISNGFLLEEVNDLGKY